MYVFKAQKTYYTQVGTCFVDTYGYFSDVEHC